VLKDPQSEHQPPDVETPPARGNSHGRGNVRAAALPDRRNTESGSQAVLPWSASAPADAATDAPPDEQPSHRLWLWFWAGLQSSEVASFLASFVVHSLAAAVLMLLMLVKDVPVPAVLLIAHMEGPESVDLAAEVMTPDLPASRPVEPSATTQPLSDPQPPRLKIASSQPTATPLLQEIGTWLSQAGKMEWDAPRDVQVTGSLDGRSAAMRQAQGLQRGATRQSEAAVERGIRWLVVHQLANGGWSFDHRKGNCQGLCRDPGTNTSTTAATGLVLLTLLGAGYTHQSGEYQDNMHRALYYLAGRGRATDRGRDYLEGDKAMYGQGLASMALCEAYAMTGDPGLRQLAQQSIEFIIAAQDRKTGGWRYRPGDAGDTTVTGWQLMALRSAQMARFHVPSTSDQMVCRFLDLVQTQEGALYGYMPGEKSPRHATTAIGLLCRMYTGWGRDNPALGQGVKMLAEWGPAKDDMYFNYYATQVLHHYEGPAWEAWNRTMREFLIASQADQGHEAGSWYFPGNYG